MHGVIAADRPLEPLGFQRIATITTTVVNLTVPNGASYAYIQADGGALRWRDDGTQPTATVGHLLAADDDLWYVADLNKIQFIRNTGEAATTNLHISFYKPS